MNKGYIFFHEYKIPFVLEDYRIELFSDDNILNNFTNEYNFTSRYILRGQCFSYGSRGQEATFLVEYSIGSTCYLCCYIIYRLTVNEGYDTIGLQSHFLDDVFKYKYNYIDMVRSGVNLISEPRIVYEVPFSMNNVLYNLLFRIGHNNDLGLLEDLDRRGELLISLTCDNIQECYNISVVLYRLAMFMLSHTKVPFKRISLYKKGINVGWFYCPLVSENAISINDVFFFEFDVMKYIPKILSNIAQDSGNKITKSIPLGHLGDFTSLHSPQRYVEQVMAFEYMFDKLYPKESQSLKFPLKKKLKQMFDIFPELLSTLKLTSDNVSDQIKEIRRTITHGYAYYYDFNNEYHILNLTILLDKLIKYMSLLWIGFSKDEISAFPTY